MKIKRPLSIDPPSVRYGIQLAAEVAADYDKYSYHDHLVSECILGKLNVLKRRPKRNPAAAKIKKALDRLERKVDRIEGTTRFMAMAALRRATQKECHRTPEQWAKELGRRSKLSNFSGRQAQAEIAAFIREVIVQELR